MFWKLSRNFLETLETFLYSILKFYWKKDSNTGVYYLRKFLKMDDIWQLLLKSLGRLLSTYLNFSLQQFFYLLFYYNVTLNVNKKIFLNSHVRAHSLQNKHAREFLKGSYSDHFQWCNQAESIEIVICLTFWLIPFFWSTMFQGKRERVLLKF